MMKTHGVVNHSVAFKSDAGVHTNHADGAHGTVKTWVRGLWKGFGQKGTTVEERAALGAYMYNKAPVPMFQSNWQLWCATRFVALLKLVRHYWVGANPAFVFAAGGTEPEEDDVEEEEGSDDGDGEAEDVNPEDEYLLEVQTTEDGLKSLRKGYVC